MSLSIVREPLLPSWARSVNRVVNRKSLGDVGMGGGRGGGCGAIMAMGAASTVRGAGYCRGEKHCWNSWALGIWDAVGLQAQLNFGDFWGSWAQLGCWLLLGFMDTVGVQALLGLGCC